MLLSTSWVLQHHRYYVVLRGGLAVGCWTCDLQVAGYAPCRSAFM